MKALIALLISGTILGLGYTFDRDVEVAAFASVFGVILPWVQSLHLNGVPENTTGTNNTTTSTPDNVATSNSTADQNSTAVADTATPNQVGDASNTTSSNEVADVDTKANDDDIKELSGSTDASSSQDIEVATATGAPVETPSPPAPEARSRFSGSNLQYAYMSPPVHRYPNAPGFTYRSPRFYVARPTQGAGMYGRRSWHP